MSTIIVAAILGIIRPYRERGRNNEEIASESVVLIQMDLLFLASNPELEPEMRDRMGYTMIGFVGLFILVSQGSLLYSGLRKVKLSCKRRMALRKGKKLS